MKFIDYFINNFLKSNLLKRNIVMIFRWENILPLIRSFFPFRLNFSRRKEH